MSENPWRGSHARNFTTNVPKILDLKSSFEQTFFRKLSSGAPAYSAVIKPVKRHHEPPVLLYFNCFPGWLAWFSLQMFCLNNKIHFSLANANNSARFKTKKAKNHRSGFSRSQTTNDLLNEAANDSARVSGQDRKKLSALGTNQSAGFAGFRPLASLEKNNYNYNRPFARWSVLLLRPELFRQCFFFPYLNLVILVRFK